LTAAECGPRVRITVRLFSPVRIGYRSGWTGHYPGPRPGEEPSSAFAALFVEECQRLLGRIRRVPRILERWLHLIRRIWEKELLAEHMRAEPKWRLEGWDTFAGESYPISGEYQSEALAVAAAKRQLEELEQEQPRESSGGPSGIQDAVYVVGPAGQRYRVLPS
jgi:hypothetical protein